MVVTHIKQKLVCGVTENQCFQKFWFYLYQIHIPKVIVPLTTTLLLFSINLVFHNSIAITVLPCEFTVFEIPRSEHCAVCLYERSRIATMSYCCLLSFAVGKGLGLSPKADNGFDRQYMFEERVNMLCI